MRVYSKPQSGGRSTKTSTKLNSPVKAEVKTKSPIARVKSWIKKTHNPDYYKRKTELTKAKTEYAKAKHQENLTKGGIKGAWARHKEGIFRRQREAEAKTRTVEGTEQMKPNLKAKLAEIEARNEGKAKVEVAKARGRTAAAAALAPSIAVLGQGLSDENNQDDERRYKNLETIFGNIENQQTPEGSGADVSGLTKGDL